MNPELIYRLIKACHQLGKLESELLKKNKHSLIKMTRRYALRDDQWERIKNLLPGREGYVGATAER